MKVSIRLFDCLDTLFQRVKGDSKDRDWTDASGLRWTTLAELRKLSREMKSNPEIRTGRACTVDKIIRLFNGLFILKGGDVVKKELEMCAAEESDQDVRLILKMLLITRQANQEEKNNAETMIDMVIKTFTNPK